MTFLRDIERYKEAIYPHSSLPSVFLRCLFAHPAILAVLWFRFGSFSRRLSIPIINLFFRCIYWLFFPLVRLLTGIQILPSTSIGQGFVLLHYGTTIINQRSKIGKNCVFFHNVTLASDDDLSCPTLEDNVMLGANVLIFGGVTVGHDSIVGAGSVVTKSLPPNCIAGGVPAKIIGTRNNAKGVDTSQ